MGTSNYSERQHWLKIFPSIGKKCLYKIEPVLVYAIFHEIFVISLSFDYYFSFFPYRFKDVLPYDENRVKLAAGDKDNRNGYINASHVSATVGNQQRFYIAGQGPLPHTVPHFWQASIILLVEQEFTSGLTGSQ